MADETRTPSAGGHAVRWAAVVSCWLCGIRLQRYQMVPDGGHACGDIRWYCQDTRACTERWTSARRRAQAGRAVSGSGAVAAPLSIGAAVGPVQRRQRGDRGPRHQTGERFLGVGNDLPDVEGGQPPGALENASVDHHGIDAARAEQPARPQQEIAVAARPVGIGMVGNVGDAAAAGALTAAADLLRE